MLNTEINPKSSRPSNDEAQDARVDAAKSRKLAEKRFRDGERLKASWHSRRARALEWYAECLERGLYPWVERGLYGRAS